MARTYKPNGDLFKVTCEGQYYGLINGQKTIKQYEHSFVADGHAKKSGFLSAFRNAMIEKDGQQSEILRALKRKYPDWKRFRTHVVVETINLSNNKPVKELSLMNRAQIVAYIDKKGLPVDSDLYPSVTDLRQALKDWRENPAMFETHQEKRRLTKGPSLAVIRSIDELNSPEFLASLASKAEKPPVLSHSQDDDIDIDRAAVDLYAMDDSDEDTDPDGIPAFDEEDEITSLIAGV